MKNTRVIVLFILVLAVINCTKRNDVVKSENSLKSKGISIEEARQSITQKLSSSSSEKSIGENNSSLLPQKKEPNWNEASQLTINSEDILEVPLTFEKIRNYSIDDEVGNLKKKVLSKSILVFSKKQGLNLTHAIMTIIPDKNYLSGVTSLENIGYKRIPKDYSGIILYHTVDNILLLGWRYENGKITKIISNENLGNLPSNSITKDIYSDDCSTFQVTVWCVDCIDWYVNNVYNHTSCGGSYICNQYTYSQCTTSGGGGDYGGGGYDDNGGYDISTEIFIASPSAAAINFQLYLKCFSSMAGSTYTITVAVDQPLPGTREPYTSDGSAGNSSSSKGDIDVGHTFLILTQRNSNGSAIIRSFGYYPTEGVSPWDPTSSGEYVPDNNHPYNIALTTAVPYATFETFLNSFKYGTVPEYNLGSSNCTSMCINELDKIGIILPKTTGTWPFFGSGYNPGDLGEDIRNMPLAPNQSRSIGSSRAPNLTGACL